MDDRKILSEVVYIQRNRLMWKDAPVDYSPLKTLYNCWKRWSRMGVFATIMTELAAEVPQIEMVMMPGPVGPVLLGDASIACQAMDQKVLMVTCPPETLSL